MSGPVHAVIGTDEGRVSEEALALFNELKPVGEAEEFTNDVIEGTAANAEEAYRACARTIEALQTCLLYTSPSPRDGLLSRMPSSA